MGFEIRDDSWFLLSVVSWFDIVHSIAEIPRSPSFLLTKRTLLCKVVLGTNHERKS